MASGRVLRLSGLALVVTGALLAVGGAFSFLFGFENIDFTVGTTFVFVGAISFTGGLVLIALGLLLRIGVRIADALEKPLDLPAFVPVSREQPAPAPRPAPRAAPAREPAREVARARPVDPEPSPAPPPAPVFAPAPEPASEAPVFGAMPEPAKPVPGFEPLPHRPIPDPRGPAKAEAGRADWLTQLATRPPRPEAPGTPARPPAAAPFRSGSVSGLSYILFTDGTIEVETAEGKRRFDDVDAFNGWLESRKN